MSKLTNIRGSVQVAALPWRMRGREIEVLLITSRETHRWLIPKGWPMKGKCNADAAAIEALQEAGVSGTIAKDPIGNFPYIKIMPEGTGLPCVVEVFPLHVTEELGAWKEASQRTREWMPIERAAMVAFEPGLAELIGSIDHNLLYEGEPAAIGRRKR